MLTIAVANGFSNMLYYLELWHNVPTNLFLFLLNSLEMITLIRFLHLLHNLEHCSVTFELT